MRKLPLISSILALASFSLFSCGQSGTTSSEVEKTNRIVLNSTSVALGIGDTFYLTVAYEDLDQDYDVIFTSSDPSVITVDEEGVVTAIAEGSAWVDVSKGNANAKCDFLVSLNDLVPALVVEGIEDHHLSLDTQTPFTFDSKVRFGNAFFEPESLTYSIESITGEGRMEGDTFIPTKQGTLNLKINASFRGNELHVYPIFIEIKESVIFTLKEKNEEGREYAEIRLYTFEQYKEQTYRTEFTPLIGLNVNGEDLSDQIEMTVVDTEGVVNYDSSSHTISSAKMGKASLLLTYGSYSKEIPIMVNYVYIDEYIDEDLIIDASVGEFPSDIFDYFPGDETILKAPSVDGSVEYQVQGGKVLGIQSHNLAEQQIVLFNSKAACVVTFKAYAKVITSAEDLKDFQIDFGADIEKVQKYQNDGYYIVANDIDCSGVSYGDNTRMIGKGPNEITPSCGFVGTFDGQGHVIRNFEAPFGGLFLILGNRAEVKNVAFVDAKITNNSKNNKFVLATYVYGATVKNVFINSASSMVSQDNAMGAACFTDSANVNCCLFEYTGSVSAPLNYGAMTVLTQSTRFNDSSYNSVILVSETPMTVNRKYYCDTRRYADLDAKEYGYRPVSTIKHYSTYEDMANSTNDYSAFDEKYWSTEGNILSWKNA